ncbi:MAG: ABC transporter ATP-binding protein [Rhizobiaceae bacterium]
MNKSAPVASARPWVAEAETPFIRIHKVTKRFGDFTAVDEVSLDIYRGELFCLLGGSGCGKSTLLRMLAGFEEPSEGRIEIDGQDMSGIPPYERPTNMMFQSYALFPHMTVERNIAYGLLREGVKRDEAMERVADILKLVQMTQFARRKPHQLSGGQRQRVALARSLVKRPKVLLLDEPLGALDKKLREETQFELLKIQETLGITFIVVTHDQEEAMTLSTRIGVMEAGQIIQVGEPAAIYEHPSSRFVADFVGSVNLFEGRISLDAKDRLEIESAEAGGTIHVGHSASCTLDQKVWYALRPEKVRLDREEPEDEPNRARGTVEEVLYLGGQSIYKIRLDSGKTVKATKPNLVRHEDDVISWDEPVWISWGDTAGVVLTQ